MRTRLSIVCILACGLTSLSAATARAQSSLEVPGPSNQNPNAAPAPAPAWPNIRLAPSGSDNGNTIQLLPNWNQPPAQPQAAATPPPPPAHMNVAPMTAQGPTLPAVFRGCWQGEVTQLDWIRRDPSSPHKIGFWTPKTYRLCYRRVGDQPFTLTFTETGVEASDKIIHPYGHVEPIATDGRAYASMRSRLNFDEYKTRADGLSPTFAVNEITNLDCRIAGDDMLVNADVFGTRDGEPWFSAHWRADFRRAAD